MTDELRASEASAFRTALLGAGRVKLSSAQVWAAWCAAVPRLVGAPGQERALLRCLRSFADDAVIELPASDRAAEQLSAPPTFVSVPSTRRPARAHPWTTYPWRGQLGWVSSLKNLTTDMFADLAAINVWLGTVEGGDVPLVPVRYRSAEIFGREKRLDELLKTSQFGHGRLTLEPLRCVRTAPPLAAAVVGTGADVLVVENVDTYWVVLDALRTATGHDIGAVVWGSGRSFPAQVRSLGIDVAGRGPVRGTIWYWGDYDPIGVDIAVQAARAAGELDFRLARGLWAAMAHVPVQQAGEYDWTRTTRAPLFDDLTWNRLHTVRSAGGRVAQEAVSVNTVTAWAGELPATRH